MPVLGASVLSAVTVALGSAPSSAEGVFTNLSLPKISGKAVEGEVLEEQHATWSTPPVSSAYQWQRCNSTGEHCEAIKKATAQTYRLTAADVGFTIRVNESGKDSAGATTPAISEPTAVVQAGAGGGQGGGNGGGQSGGGQSGGSSGGNTPPTHTPSHINRAALRRSLARQLTPAGRAAVRATLLRHGGVSMRLSLSVGGTLVVHWYLLPAAQAHIGKGPTLVATGRVTLRASRAGTIDIRLTTRGRQLLGHAGQARLEAKGAFALKGGGTVSASSRFALRG